MKRWVHGKAVFLALASTILRPSEAVRCLSDYDASCASIYINSQIILLGGDGRIKGLLNRRMAYGGGE